MKFSVFKDKLPSVSNILLAILSAILLMLAFPDLELWLLANFALIPLLFAIERQKESFAKSFITGWIFGTAFIFGSCYWMTYAPTNYGGIPFIISAILLLCAALTVSIFMGIFGGTLSLVLKRFGTVGILSAPFLWTATEFLRFWITGNNWNAIAYSQAFMGIKEWASIGGIYLVGFLCAAYNTLGMIAILVNREKLRIGNKSQLSFANLILILIFSGLCCVAIFSTQFIFKYNVETLSKPFDTKSEISVVAIQPNVPMSGLKYETWTKLRDRHVELSEIGLKELENKGRTKDKGNRIVIFPESPMNFAYTYDREFQQFLREFAVKNNVSVLFNAAEPTENDGLYNSAVMVNEKGDKIVQYDKIYLVPFGEFVPFPQPLASLVPTVAGNFEKGHNYNLMPFGDAKAGIMLCYESHFPILSRRLVGDGADFLVEMTNDGYLGNTAILRQHLANTVFRAIETNRPVLRTTNVGITAYVNEKGEVIEPSKPYAEESRLWTVSKSDGSQTIYVKYGDWFAWFCLIVSFGLIIFGIKKDKSNSVEK